VPLLVVLGGHAPLPRYSVAVAHPLPRCCVGCANATLPCVLARDAGVFSQGIVDSEVAGVVAHTMPLLVGRGVRAPIWPCTSHQGKHT